MPALSMLNHHRSAGAHAIRVRRRRDPARRRAWRLRSRRAQVSAVATILGLLLVVTYIANYISTTLPNTMGQNDLQHEIVVQNQVAQLSALLQATAESGALDAQISAPVTLGSNGAPPFANADSSTITPGNLSTGLRVNFTIVGPNTYSPPTGGPAGGIIQGSSCVNTPTTITCSGAATIVYNYTGSLGGQSAYSLTLSGGGAAHVNISTNHATITITASATTLIVLYVLGSNDTVSVTVSSTPENIVIVGNDDTVSLTGSATNSFTKVLVVGNRDTVTTSALSGGNTVVASVYGSSDVVNPGVLSGTAKFSVYFNGFNTSAPSATCPVDDLASSDTISQPVGGSGPFAVTYNNTTGTTGSKTNGVWGVTYAIPTPFACPFFSQLVLPLGGGVAPPRASLVVHMSNTYIPAAEVAFDQGAVVFAQPDSIPIFVMPPRISYSSGVLQLFLPRFTGTPGSEAGVGTTDVSLRLLSVQQVVLPTGGFTFQSSSKVTITVVTPYGAAWAAYFLASSAFASIVSCAPTNCATLATTAYSIGSSLDTITLSVPTSGLKFSALIGYFSISVV